MRFTLLGVFLELGCKVSHLALAWIAKKPYTSTVILGASKPEQVIDNLKALEVIPKLTPEILAKIEEILGNEPEPEVRLPSWVLCYVAFLTDPLVHIWSSTVRQASEIALLDKGMGTRARQEADFTEKYQ